MNYYYSNNCNFDKNDWEECGRENRNTDCRRSQHSCTFPPEMCFNDRHCNDNKKYEDNCEWKENDCDYRKDMKSNCRCNRERENNCEQRSQKRCSCGFFKIFGC